MKTRLRALALFAALWLGACTPGQGLPGEDPDAGGEAAPRAVPVETAPVTRGDMEQTLESAATISARREVLVLAEVTGQVTSVKVEEGDSVQQGQDLARLQNRQIEQAVPSAEITVSRMRQEKQNLQPLKDKGYVSRQTYEEIDYQLRQAQQQLQAARGQLQSLRVRAPMSGLVARRSVQPGQQVTPGGELFYLVDPDQLEVLLRVPERSLGQIKEGTRGYVTSQALGESLRFPAHVRLINPVVDPRTGTIKVTLAIDQAQLQQQRLRPGMLVNARLITSQRPEVLQVPRRALVRDGDRTWVFVAQAQGEGHKAQKVAVQTGLRQDDQVEVLSGLQEGQAVVVLGQTGLKEGTPLQVVTP